MPKNFAYDALVIGSGPNGLAAAIRLAQHKLSVLVVEGAPTIGGGARSAELTLPGFVHDVCSAVHPLALASPFFRTLPLEKYGLHWIQPEFPLAHPLADGRAVILHRSIQETVGGLGSDRQAYEKLFARFVENWQSLFPQLLQPLIRLPRHPVQLARFGMHAFRSTISLTKSRFESEEAAALFGGLAAHSFLPLERRTSAAFGLVLGIAAHAVGWPLPRGGSQNLANALANLLRSLGGEIATRTPVTNVDELPLARVVLFDVTPLQLLETAGHKLPSSYRARLERYRYGPGVFKIDYALAAPIPWRAAKCARAGTVHVGGTLEEIAKSEVEVAEGKPPTKPFLLISQPTLFDASRAPANKHIAWTYCHVPHGSEFDMTERMEAQLERFAPGFRELVLARHTKNCSALERNNPNLVGGDINGGAADIRQLFARPVFSPSPYRIPVPGFYLCSASTPPGGGVHGMCGYHAAEAALKDCFK